MAKDHIYLGNEFAETISFTPKGQGGGEKTLPDRNVSEHAAWLREKYSESIASAEETIRNRRGEGVSVRTLAHT